MAKVERVRIICRDPSGAVLLMKWRDPVNGRLFWEPPGGGIESGESPHDAAIRELYEETGLTIDIPLDSVHVERDYEWIGRRYRHTEAFFAVSTGFAEVTLAKPTPNEVATFVEMRFIPTEELGLLHEPLEPPTLIDVLGAI